MSPTIIQLIATYSMLYGVDPNMALAVASHESKMNAEAVGALGELGLMQLRPEYFADSCKRPQTSQKPCGQELLRPDVNLMTGIRHLAYLQKTCHHKSDGTWVICHNLGLAGGARIRHPKEFIYYRLVMIEYNQFQDQNLFAVAKQSNRVAINP